VAKYARKMGKPVLRVPTRTLERLQAYPWPGNVRELENVIERAMILSSGVVLEVDDLLDPQAASPGQLTSLSLEEAERNHVCAVLEETGWQIEGPNGAARRLEINPSTLRSRMRKLGLERPRPAPRR
jgi:DNA-binding NtrC family response regulator